MAFDQSARRSRYARQPTGKHIRFTERDAVIFTQLFRYRYLNSKQLVALLKPQSEKRFADGKCQSVIYELTEQGRNWLAQQGIKPDRVTLFSRRERPSVRVQFEHRLLVIAHVVSVDLATKE